MKRRPRTKWSRRPAARTGPAVVAAATLLAAQACGNGEEAAPRADAGASSPEAEAVTENPVVQLLAAGEPVFGIFSGDHTSEQGQQIVQNPELDFVFYSLESGPWDMDALGAYRAGMREGAARSGASRAPQPVLLRIPPVRELGPEETGSRVRDALDAGVAGIVFPHVFTADEAAVAVRSLGERAWPANPSGDLLAALIIEDREAIENAQEIVSTPGVGVVIPGPGDLRRSFEGDMEAVEEAIQTVLAACLEFDVACGITAGVDDIGTRLEQGFRFFIVTQPEAVGAGRRASGRSN